MASAAAKPSKNQLRRAKKKVQKKKTSVEPTPEPETEKAASPEKPATNGATTENSSKDGASFDEPIVMDEENPLYDMYKDIMGKFEEADKADPALKEPDKPEVYYSDDDDIPEEEDAVPKMSKKKRKMQSKLSVAELKALVRKPETVDWTDTDATDPRLLVHIKSYRNVVPVPGHWALKREYLSSKRGVEKPPFALPKFIQETGIAEMRDAVLEKQDQASLKQRQRERVAPKMGKLDIDYQKLYEAFFRFQTKPELTRYGEVYYEGKEYETNLRHLRPGELSDDLKDALNIPPGAPPPWLINQQRYGPPPSYPALKIPGLNAPPPPGASWGFHPGGYGKPPVDEATNRPLYGGDIFGVLQQQQNTQQGEPVERDLWGELQPPEEESEEEESEEEESEAGEEEEEEEEVDARAPKRSGTETSTGLASAVPTEFGGTETVSEFDLRKRRGTETEESSAPRSAYQIVPERQTRVEGFFGGDRAYDLRGAQNNMPILGQEESRKRKKPGDVDVAVNPDDLQAADGLDKSNLKNLYEQQRKAEQNPDWGFQEDLSDLIASESHKRQKKEQERRSKRIVVVKPTWIEEGTSPCTRGICIAEYSEADSNHPSVTSFSLIGHSKIMRAEEPLAILHRSETIRARRLGINLATSTSREVARRKLQVDIHHRSQDFTLLSDENNLPLPASDCVVELEASGERDRDDPNVQWMGAGESYRPGGGTSAPPFRALDRERPPADTWSAARRDDRRDERREEIDSYVPPTSQRAVRTRSRSPGDFRRRSRSPVGRGRDDTYVPRARTPPRRFSPRRDERPRSPPRRRSPSPRSARPRSPFEKRPRDFSTGPRRSPPPAKRERLSSLGRGRFDGGRSPRRAYSPPREVSNRGGYRPRSRTPPRRDDRPTFQNNTWRRSPSPRASGPASASTSRRSSPPVHPDRASLAGSLGPRSPAYAPARSQHDSRPTRSPSRAEPSPAPRSFADRSQEPTPPRQGYGRNGDTPNSAQPPTGPGGHRNNGYDRPPPSGPSRGGYQGNQQTPPSGPAMSVSAHNRLSAPSAMLSAPTRPRGGPSPRFEAPTGPQRDFSAPSAPRGPGGMPVRGFPRTTVWQNPSLENAPLGPRGRGEYSSSPSRGEYSVNFGRGASSVGATPDGPFPFRQHNNSLSTTYPRTQRFNNSTPVAVNHLATTEKLVPGGKLMPSGLPAEQERKMRMLEAEAERIRAEIAEKQRAKREALMDWEVRERESEREGLKSELAEASLNKLSEGDGGGAAF